MSDLVKQLVEERIRALSDDIDVSVGNNVYSKQDLLDHVKKGDEIGEQISEIQIKFLQDLATGKIYGEENTNH